MLESTYATLDIINNCESFFGSSRNKLQGISKTQHTIANFLPSSSLEAFRGAQDTSHSNHFLTAIVINFTTTVSLVILLLVCICKKRSQAFNPIVSDVGTMPWPDVRSHN